MLLVIQCKDWLEPKSNAIAAWRASQEFFYRDQAQPGKKEPQRTQPEQPLCTQAGEPLRIELGDSTVVHVVFMLATSKPLRMTVEAGAAPALTPGRGGGLPIVTLGPQEGVLNFVSMRDWLPTAAYAGEMAHRLRLLRMFRVEAVVGK